MDVWIPKKKDVFVFFYSYIIDKKVSRVFVMSFRTYFIQSHSQFQNQTGYIQNKLSNPLFFSRSNTRLLFILSRRKLIIYLEETPNSLVI
jgi:hypothetical protein